MKYQAGFVQEKSGSWQGRYARWSVDPDTGEKRRRQIAYTIGPVASMTKTQAKQRLQEKIAQELGVTGDGTATLKWFAQCRWKVYKEAGWRESTKRTSEELLEVIYQKFGDVPLEKLDGVKLQQWLNALARQKSGSMVKHLRIFLKSILKQAVQEGYLRRDPAYMLKVPRTKAVAKPYLSIEEIAALLKAAQFFPREGTLLTLALATAMRPSELLALRWNCLSDDYTGLTIRETAYRGVLRPFSKTTQANEVSEYTSQFIPRVTANSLETWHRLTKHGAPDDFVFATESGGFWWKENYQRRVLNPLAERAGVRHFNFQMLRRTTATYFVGSPKDLAMLMRHRKADTSLQHYAQPVIESMRSSNEALATKLLGGETA